MALAVVPLSQVHLVSQPVTNLRHLQHLRLRLRIMRVTFDFQAAGGELAVFLRTAHRRLTASHATWNQRGKVGAVPRRSAGSVSQVRHLGQPCSA
jgi:hypothetical protein